MPYDGDASQTWSACPILNPSPLPSRDSILDLKKRISTSVIGQEDVIDQLLIGLLASGPTSAPARARWARGAVAAVVVLLVYAFVLRRHLVPAMGRLLSPLRPHHLQPLNPNSDTAKP